MQEIEKIKGIAFAGCNVRGRILTSGYDGTSVGLKEL